MYLNSILQTLTQSGLDYCIQNGYEDMPNSFPTDIDIFYRGATERDLDKLVSTIAEKTGLLVLQKVAMGYYQFVYWLTPQLPEAGFQLELDFQSELSLKSMPHYYIPDRLLDRKQQFRGFYIPSPVDEIVYTILRRTVKHNFTERHLATLQKAYNTNPVDIEKALKEELPESIVEDIIELIRSNSANKFDYYYKDFREYVCRVSARSTSVSKRISQYWYNFSRMLPLRFFSPCGMDIALLSPDGGGKSTILNALKEYNLNSFAPVVRKYIRPTMFQNIGQYKPNAAPEMTDNPDPHGRKPDGVLKSWIRFLVYMVDFTIGYFVKVVPLKWARHLVVFDRYYYDYYVDTYRYHYTLPKWVPRFFGHFVPHPTITFVLYAPAKVLYERKKELTLEETSRQCEAFKRVAETTKGAVLIDVNRPVEEIVHDIVEHIVAKRVELTKRKIKK